MEDTTNTTISLSIEIVDGEYLAGTLVEACNDLLERIDTLGKDHPFSTVEEREELLEIWKAQHSALSKLTDSLFRALADVEYVEKEEEFFSGELDPSVDLLDANDQDNWDREAQAMYAEGEGETCIDCDAFRPRVDGKVHKDGWVCSDCTGDRQVQPANVINFPTDDGGAK